MTATEAASLLPVYGAGLEAELSLLKQLRGLADLQRDAIEDNALDRLRQIADERDRLMAGLVAIEAEIVPLRQALCEDRRIAQSLDGFRELVALHQAAGDLVRTILSSDVETVRALRDAELARRFATQLVDSGELTLAAYKRVIAPPLASAGLVDTRG